MVLFRPQAPNLPAVPLSINDPTRDTKGKKRAAPEPDTSSPLPSDNDNDSPKAPPPKKARITRNTTKAAASKSQKKGMSRKNKSSVPSTTAKSRAAKNRATSGPSAPIRDNDVEMLDGDLQSDPENPDERMDIQEKQHVEDEDNESDDDIADANREPRNNDPVGAGSSGTADPAPPPPPSAAVPNPPSAFGEDHPSAMAMFSSDFRSLGAHMLAQSTKLKGYLAAIKPTSDPTVRFAALQELNELLVMSNEDTLSGYFQVDAFVKELIGILGGKSLAGDEDEDDGGDDEGEDDEDAALAAALAMSTGGVLAGDENPEAQVLASRCLYNLMEALPGSAHTIVYHGAVPALCSKLLEIQFIDLAEQNISVGLFPNPDAFITSNNPVSRPLTKSQRSVQAPWLVREGYQHCLTSLISSTHLFSAPPSMQLQIVVGMLLPMFSRPFERHFRPYEMSSRILINVLLNQHPFVSFERSKAIIAHSQIYLTNY